MDNVVSFEEAIEMRNAGNVNLVYSMPGKQTDFIKSPADRIIYGGAVSGGKSRGLMLAPLKNLLTNPLYNAVIARRTFPELDQEGGLIQESQLVYKPLGAEYNITKHYWTFPLKNRLRFVNIMDERKIEAKDGGQFTFLGIDEAQHWDEDLVDALWIRARGISGFRTQLCMTCNPKKRSWMRYKWLGWYLDDNGFPIPERSGVLRYYYRGDHGEMIWFNNQMDALKWWARQFPDRYEIAIRNPDRMIFPESFTFIFSKATDNTIMMEGDPDYESKMENQPKAYKNAKLLGCWDFDEGDKIHFDAEWVGEPLDWVLRKGTNQYFDLNGNLKGTIVKCARGYDFAYTPKTENNNPDWTTCTFMALLDSGVTLIGDHEFNQKGSNEIVPMIKRLAAKDPDMTEIVIPDEVAGGQGFVNDIMRDLPLLKINKRKEYGAPRDSDLTAKEYRFLPFSRQCQAGNLVKMIRNDNWNDRAIMIWEALGSPESRKMKKDDCDSASKCYNFLHEDEGVNSDSLF